MEYECKICNKKYSSYQSLWIHNKKFHSKNNNKLTSDNKITTMNNNIISIDNNIIISKKIYNCKYCNKNYNLQQSKWYHEQNCKMKDNKLEIELEKIKLEQINAEKEKLKEEKEKLKEEKEKLKEEKEILKLKIKLQNGTTNNTTNNNNNGTINNNNIKISFCTEDIDTISKEDKQGILNSGYLSLLKLIETMHLNKDYPEYQNIKIANLKDNFAKTYDEETETFTTVYKKDSIDDLICSRTCDLKSIYKDLSNKKNNFHRCVLKLIDKIESCNGGVIDDKDKLDYYKNLQKEIILLIYNKTKMFN
jgi:hypothetical protein